jgi:tRNA pseudouridine-54 N-methylase
MTYLLKCALRIEFRIRDMEGSSTRVDVVRRSVNSIHCAPSSQLQCHSSLREPDRTRHISMLSYLSREDGGGNGPASY